LSRIILAIDTTTDVFCLGLSNDGELVGEKNIPGRKHSERLIEEIDSLLKSNSIAQKDLSVIGIGVGPGSFTGIRVGMSVAITMAQFLDIPLYGISALDIAGQNSSDPVIKAFRDKYYHAHYSENGYRETDFEIVGSDIVKEQGFSEVLINAQDMIRFIESRIDSGDPGDWKTIEPLYVMATEYKPKKPLI